MKKKLQKLKHKKQAMKSKDENINGEPNIGIGNQISNRGMKKRTKQMLM